MRHTMIAAAVLAATMLAAGCENSDDRTAAVGPSTTGSTLTSSATSVPTVVDLQFINALDRAPVMYGSESGIIAIGHKVCDARQSGVSEGDVIATIMSTHYGYVAAETIVDYAEKYYCPQFSVATG